MYFSAVDLDDHLPRNIIFNGTPLSKRSNAEPTLKEWPLNWGGWKSHRGHGLVLGGEVNGIEIVKVYWYLPIEMVGCAR